MKIAMIGHKRIPSREGGVEIVVEELAVRMVRLGHCVHVYNRLGHHVSGVEVDNINIKSFKGIKIITIPTFQNRQLNALVYSFLATLRAIFGKYDIVHFHASGPCAMIWLTRIFGIKTVATLHGIDSQRSKWGGIASKYLRFGEKIASKYSDELIVLSKNNQDYIYKTYGRVANFIPNGVNRPILRDTCEIKAKYKLEKDSYILYLGRIVPEKGLHYLIEAYKNINTNIKLIIAGGSSHTDDYGNEVRKLAQKDNRIVFVGFVQGLELEELFSNAYIYVLPSDLEGMPISLLEAMSYGNCCLVSDIPENTEVVEEKALTFQRGNVKDLKAKLEQLITNRSMTDGYKKEAKEFIINKYSWSEVVEKTLKLYSQVIINERK